MNLNESQEIFFATVHRKNQDVHRKVEKLSKETAALNDSVEKALSGRVVARSIAGLFLTVLTLVTLTLVCAAWF